MLHVQVLSCECTDPGSLQSERLIYTYAYLCLSLDNIRYLYVFPQVRSDIMTSVNSPACLLARNHFKRSMDTQKRMHAHSCTYVIYIYRYIYNVNMCDESEKHICCNRCC